MKPIDWHMQYWNWTGQSRLVVLTGAGISAESGIKTFRDANGLWENHPIEEVATPEGFARNPELVLKFYNARRTQLFEVDPNPAHKALASIQKKIGGRFFLVTQNVDDLHERGGSIQVLHMHGELKKLRCLECHEVKEITTKKKAVQNIEDQCTTCSGDLRPHIVWFGEIPFDMDFINEQLSCCTHFIYIGTSSLVYPAAGFKQVVKSNGLNAKVLCINLEIDLTDPHTDFYMEGKAGEILPNIITNFI